MALLLFYGVGRWNTKAAVRSIAALSMLFLLAIDWRSFLLLSTCVAYNYGYIKRFSTHRFSGYFLLFGVLLNIAPFIVYKLFSSAGESGMSVVVSSNSLIPFGLAFYFLQQTSVLIEAHKGKVAHLTVPEYLLFSFFFVTLPSGPVFTYRQASQQFAQWPTVQIPYNDIATGVSLFIFGLAKYCFIAQPIGQYVDVFLQTLQHVPSVSLSFTESLYTVIGCLLQLYFTFSAYSDMAIGMALCFGIRLPVNFDSPLKSGSPVGYINTWHMSFIAYVREYVFQPVFTLCKKLPIESMEKRYASAWAIGVFFTFFTTAMWHSPSTFAMSQGVFLALVLVLFELRNTLRQRKEKTRFNAVGSIAIRALTLTSAFATGVFFYAPTFDIAKQLFAYLLQPETISVDFRLAPLLGELGLPLVTFSSFFPSITHLPSQWTDGLLFTAGWAVLHLVLAVFSVFFMPNSMQIFGLHESKHRSVLNLKWSLSVRHAVWLAMLFIFSLGLLNVDAGITYA